jgi:hypothetical protein
VPRCELYVLCLTGRCSLAFGVLWSLQHDRALSQTAANVSVCSSKLTWLRVMGFMSPCLSSQLPISLRSSAYAPALLGLGTNRLEFLVVLTNLYSPRANIPSEKEKATRAICFFNSSYLEKKSTKNTRTVPRTAIFRVPPRRGRVF